MEILQTKEECDHVQFLITEKNTSGQRQNDQTAEVETLSQGRHPKNKIKIIIVVTNFTIAEQFREEKRFTGRPPAKTY